MEQKRSRRDRQLPRRPELLALARRATDSTEMGASRQHPPCHQRCRHFDDRLRTVACASLLPGASHPCRVERETRLLSKTVQSHPQNEKAAIAFHSPRRSAIALASADERRPG